MVDRLEPGQSVAPFEVQIVDLHRAGPLTAAGIGAHHAADRAHAEIAPVHLPQVHHLVAGEIQEGAEGQSVQESLLFLQAQVRHVRLGHGEGLLPVAVPGQIQAEAGEDVPVEAGAVLVVEGGSPAVGVPQGSQGDFGQVLAGEGEIILAELFPGVEEGGGLAVAAVLVAHREIDGVIMYGEAVDDQGVRVVDLHTLQHRAHGDQPPGGLRGAPGIVRIELVPPEHQAPFRRDIPGGEPFLPVGAEGDILLPHPAGAAGGVYLIVFPVCGGGEGGHGLVHPNAHQALIVEIRVGGIVQDLPVIGEDHEQGAVHRHSQADRHILRRIGVGTVGDDRVKGLLGEGLAVLIVGPAQEILRVRPGALRQGFAPGLAVEGGREVPEIVHVGPLGGQGRGVDPGDLLRGAEKRLRVGHAVCPELGAGHLLRHAGEIGHRGGDGRGGGEQADGDAQGQKKSKYPSFHDRSSILQHDLRCNSAAYPRYTRGTRGETAQHSS